MAFELKQGDRRPFFVVVLKDDFGEASERIVDLSTATSAVFNMRAINGQVKVNRGVGTITNRAGGEVTYQWATADTDTAGSYFAEVEIPWSDGKAETFPSGPGGGNYWDIVVTDDIA
jgi:hypothetical protein